MDVGVRGRYDGELPRVICGNGLRARSMIQVGDNSNIRIYGYVLFNSLCVKFLSSLVPIRVRWAYSICTLDILARRLVVDAPTYVGRTLSRGKP